MLIPNYRWRHGCWRFMVYRGAGNRRTRRKPPTLYGRPLPGHTLTPGINPCRSCDKREKLSCAIKAPICAHDSMNSIRQTKNMLCFSYSSSGVDPLSQHWKWIDTVKITFLLPFCICYDVINLEEVHQWTIMLVFFYSGYSRCPSSSCRICQQVQRPGRCWL